MPEEMTAGQGGATPEAGAGVQAGGVAPNEAAPQAEAKGGGLLQSNQAEAGQAQSGEEGGSEARADAGETAHWSDSLPEGMREGFKGFESQDKALEAMQAVAKVRADMPESAEGYEIPVPDGLQKNEALQKEFQGLAHKAGLTKAQAKELASWFNQRALGEAKALDDMAHKADQGLRQSWGGQYEHNLAEANRGYNTFATPELRALLESNGYNNHPAVVQTFWQVGQAMSEGGYIPGESGAPAMQRDADGNPQMKFKPIEEK